MLLFFQVDLLAQLRNITPPSPEVSQLQKYVDYPVDLSTGTVSMDIPIFELKIKDLVFPIGLNYHASGFKVNDQSGVIGLGWSLNAGGLISRTINHSPDELSVFPSPFIDEAQIPNGADYEYEDFEYLHKLSRDADDFGNGKDAEYDIFYFNTGIKSGKFILASRPDGSRLPIQLSKSSTKILADNANFNAALNQFKLIDEGGNTFYFGRSLLNGYNSIETVLNTPGNLTYTSAWHLTEVVLANKTDTIFFKYQPATKYTQFRQDNIIINNSLTDFRLSPGDPLNTFTGFPQDYIMKKETMVPNTASFYHTQQLSEISFPQGKISFEYQRISSVQTDRDRLKNIMIFSKGGELIRTFTLDQSSFSNLPEDAQHLYWKLDSLTVRDKTQHEIGKYSLSYNETFPFSQQTSNLAHTSGVDYWGYFNGKTSNVDIIPYFKITSSASDPGYPGYVYSSGSDRHTDPNAVQTFILEKIKYPTGGQVKFQYEPHSAELSLENYIGGLRIKGVDYFDKDDHNVLSKRYKYGVDENGKGELMLPNDLNAYVKLKSQWYYDNPLQPPTLQYSGDVKILSNSFVNGFESVTQAPVKYSVLTEYVFDPYNGDDNGKTVYSYNVPNIYPGGNDNEGQIFTRTFDFRFNDELIKKETFRKTAQGYSLLAKDDYVYQTSLIRLLKGCMPVWGY